MLSLRQLKYFAAAAELGEAEVTSRMRTTTGFITRACGR